MSPTATARLVSDFAPPSYNYSVIVALDSLILIHNKQIQHWRKVRQILNLATSTTSHPYQQAS